MPISLPEFGSVLATKVEDHCFGEKCVIDYQHGQVLVIADIYNAGLSDCHVDILASNAVKFTESGYVSCGARVENNEVVISITDTE
ncbi:MAG: hypothetical protein F6K10_11325 [Moorea sp. SIO2B7]|nr:hypothetical protein [Moorena sp. SIO2B7]